MHFLSANCQFSVIDAFAKNLKTHSAPSEIDNLRTKSASLVVVN
jgi:hypothetical protein